MASLAVTPVTAVTNAQCHACHAPVAVTGAVTRGAPPLRGAPGVTPVTRAELQVTAQNRGSGGVTLGALVTVQGGAE